MKRFAIVMLLLWLASGASWTLAGAGSEDLGCVDALSFHSGEHFGYALEMGDNSILGQGSLDVWVHEALDGYLELHLSGTFAERTLATMAAAPLGDWEGLASNLDEALFYDAPDELWDLVQFLFTARPRYLPCSEPLQPGDVLWGTDTAGSPFELAVGPTCRYAGQDGQSIQVADASGTYLVHLCLQLDRPLPLRASAVRTQDAPTKTGEWYKDIVLQTYALDTVPPELSLSPRCLLQRRLQNLLAHFRHHGVNVGRSFSMIHDMVGATAGLSVQLDGSWVELYAFDPNTIDSEVLWLLEEARMSGVFFAVPLQKELSVAVNDVFLMTTGDVALAYPEPPRRSVEAVFLSY